MNKKLRNLVPTDVISYDGSVWSVDSAPGELSGVVWGVWLRNETGTHLFTAHPAEEVEVIVPATLGEHYNY